LTGVEISKTPALLMGWLQNWEVTHPEKNGPSESIRSLQAIKNNRLIDCVSKAADISSKLNTETFPRSAAVTTLDRTFKVAVLVEWRARNPDWNFGRSFFPPENKSMDD